jgi:hypothetical protein
MVWRVSGPRWGKTCQSTTSLDGSPVGVPSTRLARWLRLYYVQVAYHFQRCLYWPGLGGLVCILSGRKGSVETIESPILRRNVLS